MDLFQYKADVFNFNPVAVHGQNVCIRYVNSEIYRKVSFFETIPFFQCIDLGALAAATTSARTNLVNLEVYDDEFAQYRWFCLDNAQIRMFLPRGAALADLRNVQAPWDPAHALRNQDLNLTEIIVWEDNRPAVEAINGMAVALAAVRIVAGGYRFRCTDFLPVTLNEKKAVQQIKAELGASVGKKTDEDLMILAAKEGRIPCTDLWASGIGASA